MSRPVTEDDAEVRLASVVPGLATFARYDRRWLRGDLLAGITVAAYLVPQVLA